MKMAKVITLKIKMSKKVYMSMVITVDPEVTPEMVCIMCGINSKLLMKSETSEIMPLPDALELSASKKRAIGMHC